MGGDILDQPLAIRKPEVPRLIGKAIPRQPEKAANIRTGGKRPDGFDSRDFVLAIGKNGLDNHGLEIGLVFGKHPFRHDLAKGRGFRENGRELRSSDVFQHGSILC